MCVGGAGGRGGLRVSKGSTGVDSVSWAGGSWGGGGGGRTAGGWGGGRRRVDSGSDVIKGRGLIRDVT